MCISKDCKNYSKTMNLKFRCRCLSNSSIFPKKSYHFFLIKRQSMQYSSPWIWYLKVFQKNLGNRNWTKSMYYVEFCQKRGKNFFSTFAFPTVLSTFMKRWSQSQKMNRMDVLLWDKLSEVCGLFSVKANS